MGNSLALLAHADVTEGDLRELGHLQEAQDVWSLGVMAFELLTGKRALRMSEGGDKVRPQTMHARLMSSIYTQFALQLPGASFTRETMCAIT